MFNMICWTGFAAFMYNVLMTNNNIKNVCTNRVQFLDVEALPYGCTLIKS